MLYPYNDRIPSMGTNVVIIYKYLKKNSPYSMVLYGEFYFKKLT